MRAAPVAVIIAVAVAASLATPAASTGSDALEPFAWREHSMRPAAVFGGWVIGLRQTGIGDVVVAADMLTGEERVIGAAPPDSSPSFDVTPEYLVMIAPGSVTVWNASLDMVGRVAVDGAVAAKVMTGGEVVVWTRTAVLVARPPGYLTPEIVDAEGWGRAAASAVPWDEALRLTGLDPDEVVETLRKQAAPGVENATLNVTAEAPAGPVSVTVVDAAYAGGTVYVAAELTYDVNVTVSAEWVEGNTSRTSSASAAVAVEYGALIADGGLVRTYRRLLAPVSANTLAFIYAPGGGSAGFGVAFLKGGELVETPIYVMSSVREAYMFGDDVVLVGNTSYAIYRGGSLLAVVPGRVTFVSVAGTRYLIGAELPNRVEVGAYDRFSGTAGKYVIQVDGTPVGAYTDGRVLVVAADSGGRATLYAYSLSGTAVFEVSFVSPAGTPYPVVWGNATVRYGQFTVRVGITSNPAVVKAPVGAGVEVTVRAPLAEGNASFTALAPGEHEVVVTLRTPIPVGSGALVQTPPFSTAFFRDHAAVAEASLARYVLPPASSLDAEGSVVVLVRPGQLAELVAYLETGDFLWSAPVSPDTKVTIAWPYVVADSASAVVVYGIGTGATVARVAEPHTGWVIDSVGGYLAVWEGNSVTFTDLRRGSSTELVLPNNVAVAVPVAGELVAVVKTSGGAYLYVVDPIHGSVTRTEKVGDVVTGYASDGVFHAVGLASAGTEYVLLLSDYGVGTLEAGRPVWVKDLGYSVPVSQAVIGARFAALVTKEGNATVLRIVGAGGTATKVSVIGRCEGAAFTQTYYAVAEVSGTKTVRLYDWSGAERVVILADTTPALVAATPSYIVYGGADGTVVVPLPTSVGRYSIRITVTDATGKPLTGTATLTEYGARFTIEGTGTIYLSTPSNVTLSVEAPGYEPQTLTLEVSDDNPTAYASIVLQPKKYRLSVSVVDERGDPVNNAVVAAYSGTLEVDSADVVNGIAFLELPPGNYTIKLISQYYSAQPMTVLVEGSSSITIQATTVVVPFRILVLDETNAPVPNATVAAIYGTSTEVEKTGDDGSVSFALPVGIPVNISVAAEGFMPASVEVLPSTENRSVTVTLEKAVGSVTVTIKNQEGKVETATLRITNVETGEVVVTDTVTGLAAYDLPLGTYNISAVTEDGRSAWYITSLSVDRPDAMVELTLPPPPVPFYVQYFPYIVGAAVAVAVAVILIRVRK